MNGVLICPDTVDCLNCPQEERYICACCGEVSCDMKDIGVCSHCLKGRCTHV